jgi:dihydrofolate reductase
MLIYVAIASLDGFMSDLSDRDSDSTWSVPNAEVYAAILEIQRSTNTYLYGRRMYETMAVWDTALVGPDQRGFIPGAEALEREFATLWRAAEKVVFSTTLSTVSTPRTRIEHSIDPDRIRQLKSTSRDITVGGPHLAAAMLKANLVDHVHVFVHPIVIGRGLPILPAGLRLPLTLVRANRLGSVVHLHYSIEGTAREHQHG